jgi:hypothetical protein
MQQIALPDFLPYLLAILGLLLVWEVHNIQVRAGRIKAVDILNRSGIRLFIHVTPDDSAACSVCREANVTAFLPSLVASRKFRATETPCTNPAGCRCLTIGLYGGWAEAQRVQTQLPKHGGRLRLSPEEFGKFLVGAVARRSGVAADQISLTMLEAMRAEGNHPEISIERYRYVIDNAKAERDLPFVVPSYLRLADLLDRVGRKAEALSVVDEFLKSYDGKTGSNRPNDAQVSAMSLRKTRLMMVQV